MLNCLLHTFKAQFLVKINFDVSKISYCCFSLDGRRSTTRDVSVNNSTRAIIFCLWQPLQIHQTPVIYCYLLVRRNNIAVPEDTHFKACAKTYST